MVLNTISIGFINLFEQVEFLECMFFLESVKFIGESQMNVMS